MTDALEEVIAYEPDRTLRELVGETVRLAEIFTRERIAAGQQVVQDARDTFFYTAAVDVRALEELLEKNPQLPEDSVVLFDDIASHAVNIKGPAGQFGYSLVAAICGHILDHCEAGEHSAAGRYLLIAELVKFLRVALRERITDENGAIGRELRGSLSKY